MKASKQKQATATLRVVFERAGTVERGELAFTGPPEFIAFSVAPLSYVISYLEMTYGADKDNWIQTGNELNEAWDAVKRGENYTGKLVNVTIGA